MLNFDKLNEVMDNTEKSDEEKINAVKTFFNENKIEVPKGVCVCIAESKNRVLLYPTKECNLVEYMSFEQKLGTHNNPDSKCSGTYFKG